MTRMCSYNIMAYKYNCYAFSNKFLLCYTCYFIKYKVDKIPLTGNYI